MDKMLEAEIWSIARIDRGNAVLLRPLGMDLVVPIYIGPLEVHAILLGLGNVKSRRPLSCDLFLELARRLGITLFRVEIHEIRDDIFHARLFLSGRDFPPLNPLVIDSRPSDAFALAVRRKCPVFMDPKVLDRAGIPADIFINEGEDTPAFMGEEPGDAVFMNDEEEKARERPVKEGSSPLAAKRKRLQAELEEAVENEVYERAAEIRDLLILLDQEQERRGKETRGGI